VTLWPSNIINFIWTQIGPGSLCYQLRWVNVALAIYTPFTNRKLYFHIHYSSVKYSILNTQIAKEQKVLIFI